MSAIILSLTGYKINAPRYVCVYHINLCFILKIKMYILCVAGTSVNNHKSNIRNNGGYFYMVKNIKFCSYSDYGCIQVKVHNY